MPGLRRDEAQALVTFGATDPARELGLGQALMSARLKLAASLPDAIRQDVSAAAARFHLAAPGCCVPRRCAPQLEALAAAVFGDLIVEARYRGRSRARNCRLWPLGLVLKAGTWYLVAQDGDDVRGYRADRFDHVARSDQQFSRPDGFDVAAFWTSWRDEFERGLPVVTVDVRARPGCVRGLRRVVEPTHADRVDWESAPDEAGRVRLLLPFETLEYARVALLGFGADVEAVGPSELRSQLVADATGLAALYADCPPG